MNFKKKVEPPKEVVKEQPIEKTYAHCVYDECYELKAPGQTHVCQRHIRRN